MAEQQTPVVVPPAALQEVQNRLYAQLSTTAQEVVQELEAEDLSAVATAFNEPKDLLELAGPTMDVAAPAAVYRWRGARVENLRQFTTDYPGAKKEMLKAGVEQMMRHYVPEVTAVEQVI